MALQQEPIATVLAIDVSWPMSLFHIWQAVFVAVTALDEEVRVRRPDDDLKFVAFSAYADRVERAALPALTWDESVLGTNIQHATLLGHEILDVSTRSIRRLIVVTVGEATAHLEKGRSFFAYPSSPITLRETVETIRACRAAGISVTFILVTPGTARSDIEESVASFATALVGIGGVHIVRTTVDRVAADLRASYFDEPA